MARQSRPDDRGSFDPSATPIVLLQERPADPRGRRATGQGQNFVAVVVWTVLGALVPGLGLIAAGRRKLGWAVLSIFALIAGAAAGFALTGNPIERFGGLLAQPNYLLVLAGALLALMVAWVVMVIGTHASLRRYANLNMAQRIQSILLVCSLVALVGVPVLKAGSYAVIARDAITGIFSTGSGGTVAKSSGLKKGSNPWKAIPRVNVLLIGSDAGADRIGIRPDTLILASIDTKTGETVLFSLPRNLERVPFPAGTQQAADNPDGYFCVRNGVHECLLNAFWTFGEENWQTYYSSEPSAFDAGLRATADAVTAVTGLSVDQYAMVNLRGFQQFVDAIGGVTVNIYQRLPIGGSSSNPVASAWLEPGLNQHLDGYHALWYARSRWSTDDFDRMRRQRCLIGAVVEQADPATVALSFPQIAAAAKDNIITGIPMSDLSAWVMLTTKVKGAQVRSLAFTSKVINTENPDFDLMHQMVQHAIDPAAPAPLTSVSPSPSATSPVQAPGATAAATTDGTSGGGSTAAGGMESSSSPTPSAPAQEDGSGTTQDVKQVC